MSSDLPPSASALVQQFLKQYTTADVASAAFSADEISRIQQLLSNPLQPNVTAALAHVVNVNEVAEKVTALIRTNNNSTSAAAASPSPVTSSSESSIAPSSTSNTHASTPMDIDRSVNAPAAATSSSHHDSSAMEVNPPAVAFSSAVSSILADSIVKIDKDPMTADAVFNNLKSMLTELKKNPNLPANRKFRCADINVKKFIMESPGAFDIMKFVGYQTLTKKNTPYLVIEQEALASAEAKVKLDAAILAVQAQISLYVNPLHLKLRLEAIKMTTSDNRRKIQKMHDELEDQLRAKDLSENELLDLMPSALAAMEVSVRHVLRTNGIRMSCHS